MNVRAPEQRDIQKQLLQEFTAIMRSVACNVLLAVYKLGPKIMVVD